MRFFAGKKFKWFLGVGGLVLLVSFKWTMGGYLWPSQAPELVKDTLVLGSRMSTAPDGRGDKSRREVCLESSKVTLARYRRKQPERKPQENIGYPNNKFGLYVYALDDYLELASELVNSQGGRWGYVLIPYNVKDYDYAKWRSIFKLLYVKELIPIFQLWEADPDDYKKETEEAARFLNQFNWPIRNRYVSVYNEMNDARFWGREVDPESYARILAYTIKIFREENENFFMLNGAFNATAPTGEGYLDQVEYMLRMDKEVPGIFSQLDGWASHSYPQPAYRGHVYDSGRGSIKTYEWELQVLSEKFGVKSLPVFITETGWPHQQGATDNYSYFDEDVVAKLYVKAFEEVWLPDDRVVAVTPFTIFYRPPFDHFSWLKDEFGDPYPQYLAVQKIPKQAGDPPVLVKEDKTSFRCP